MRVHRLVAAAIVLTVGVVPVRAQGTVAGKWTTDYPTGIRNENGEIVVSASRPATMTLTLKGDSVIGTWQMSAAAGGTAPAPTHMTGKRSGTKFVIRNEAVERTVNMGEGPKQVQMFTQWDFEVKGETLVGTQKNMSPDGSFEGPELPFSAKRAKAP